MTAESNNPDTVHRHAEMDIQSHPNTDMLTRRLLHWQLIICEMTPHDNFAPKPNDDFDQGRQLLHASVGPCLHN